MGSQGSEKFLWAWQWVLMVSVLFKFSSLFIEQPRVIEPETRLSNSSSQITMTKFYLIVRSMESNLLTRLFSMICIFRFNSLVAGVEDLQTIGLTVEGISSLRLLGKEYLIEISFTIYLGLASKLCLFTISVSLTDTRSTCLMSLSNDSEVCLKNKQCCCIGLILSHLLRLLYYPLVSEGLQVIKSIQNLGYLVLEGLQGWLL